MQGAKRRNQHRSFRIIWEWQVSGWRTYIPLQTIFLDIFERLVWIEAVAPERREVNKSIGNKRGGPRQEEHPTRLPLYMHCTWSTTATIHALALIGHVSCMCKWEWTHARWHRRRMKSMFCLLLPLVASLSSSTRCCRQPSAGCRDRAYQRQ